MLSLVSFSHICSGWEGQSSVRGLCLFMDGLSYSPGYSSIYGNNFEHAVECSVFSNGPIFQNQKNLVVNHLETLKDGGQC